MGDQIRDRKVEGEVHLNLDNVDERGVLPLKPAQMPRLRTGEMSTTAVDGPSPHSKHVPGYTGFVPGVHAENIYARTYGHATNIAIAGDHTRFQWREQEEEERFRSSGQKELLNFGHPAKIEDGHVTYAHENNNPMRANYQSTEPERCAHHIPGYGGFLPHVQSRNMFGKTQLETTTEALKNFNESEDRKIKSTYPVAAYPATAPAGTIDSKPHLGMLQFTPSGFLYQKRMQGEWNNGMLGSRNYSAVKLAEGNIWKDGVSTTRALRRHTRATKTAMHRTSAPKALHRPSRTWTTRSSTSHCSWATTRCDAAVLGGGFFVLEARAAQYASLILVDSFGGGLLIVGSVLFVVLYTSSRRCGYSSS